MQNDKRLLSLDVLRGFDLFMLVGLQPILWQAIDRMHESATVSMIKAQIDHVQWEGFSAWDLVMPLFLFMSVVRISCYEFLVQSSFFSRFHRNSIRQLQLSNLKVASAKSVISPVDFHLRLAVSKWIVLRSFLMGGVLGSPKT